MRKLFFQPNLVFLVRVLDEFFVYSSQQKNFRVEGCQYLIEQVTSDMDYLNNVMTAENLRFT